MTATEESIAAAVASGITGLGVIAVIVGMVLLLLVAKFVMSGMTPAALVCGFALITLLNPALGLIIAILAFIIMGAKGNIYLGGQAVLGWLFGIVTMIVAVMAAIAIGVVVIV